MARVGEAGGAAVFVGEMIRGSVLEMLIWRCMLGIQVELKFFFNVYF